jgi:hypothetical protein
MKKNVLIFFLPLFLIMLTGCSLRNQIKQVGSTDSNQKLKENKTDEFFDKKQIWAKYIPQIKKEIADYKEKYDNALGNSTTILEEVFYSPKLDTCLKADYRKIKVPEGQFTYSFYIVDILTEKYILKESYKEYSMYDSFLKAIENYKKIETDKESIEINKNLNKNVEKENIEKSDKLNNNIEQENDIIVKNEVEKVEVSGDVKTEPIMKQTKENTSVVAVQLKMFDDFLEYNLIGAHIDCIVLSTYNNIISNKLTTQEELQQAFPDNKEFYDNNCRSSYLSVVENQNLLVAEPELQSLRILLSSYSDEVRTFGLYALKNGYDGSRIDNSDKIMDNLRTLSREEVINLKRKYNIN